MFLFVCIFSITSVFIWFSIPWLLMNFTVVGCSLVVSMARSSCYYFILSTCSSRFLSFGDFRDLLCASFRLLRPICAGRVKSTLASSSFVEVSPIGVFLFFRLSPCVFCLLLLLLLLLLLCRLMGGTFE